MTEQLAQIVRTQIGETIIVLDAEVVQRAKGLIADSSEIQSVDDDTFDEADRLAASLAGLHKTIEDNRKGAKRPVAALGKAIDDACSPITRELLAEKRRVAGLIGDYLERKRAEAEAIEAQAAAMLQVAMAEAEAARDADAPREQPTDLTTARGAATVVLDLPPAPLRSSVSIRQNRSVEIVDYDRIPHRINGIALLKPDTVAIRKLLDAGVDVPGALLVVTRATATRSR